MNEKISLSDLNNDDSLIPWNKLFTEEDVGIDNFDMKDLSDPFKNKQQEPEKDQSYWENLFNEMNFPGMDLMAVSYFGSFGADMLDRHIQMKRIMRDFVRLLSYNYTMDLRAAGISE